MQLRITQAAARALVEQSDALRRAGDEARATRWEQAADEAIYALLTWPKRGFPCNFAAADLAGLRWTTMPAFPTHTVFHRYLPEQELVVLVHVLPGIKNLATLMREVL